MKTMLVDPVSWDLLLDAHGNIAVASDPYSISQDVASAVKLFLGELYYDTSKGVPYFQDILGAGPSPLFFAARMELAALTVPNVVQAQCVSISSNVATRRLTGELRVIDAAGRSLGVTF